MFCFHLTLWTNRFRFWFHPATAARTVGRFTPSYEAKSASTSGVPTPSCSKQAASAFGLITGNEGIDRSPDCVFL
ncbi:hypothetical protein FHY71_00110 [Bacillus tropicus]|uniref:Uncharacterized protein n=1 Tax=Bacillus tropicus TaxID=2026188 RepID=A0A5C5ACF8_9BACI|nr:hypothetical protein FHY71_00110 [Bacillus tropicus]